MQINISPSEVNDGWLGDAVARDWCFSLGSSNCLLIGLTASALAPQQFIFYLTAKWAFQSATPVILLVTTRQGLRIKSPTSSLLTRLFPMGPPPNSPNSAPAWLFCLQDFVPAAPHSATLSPLIFVGWYPVIHFLPLSLLPGSLPTPHNLHILSLFFLSCVIIIIWNYFILIQFDSNVTKL